MSHKTKCSPEEKVLLIEKHLAGEISAMRAAEIAGVNKSSFGTWVRIYKQEGPLGLKTPGKTDTTARKSKCGLYWLICLVKEAYGRSLQDSRSGQISNWKSG